MSDIPMTRREALRAAAFAVSALAFARGEAGAASAWPAPPGVLSAADRALAVDIADTLLPTTAASPGARAAGAGPAIDLLLSDCYAEADQRLLLAGLAAFRRAHPGFARRPRAERERVLRALDDATRIAADRHWFSLFREIAERAYFSSEIGMTRALRWVPVPGRWIGCVPLKPGQPAWG